MEKKKVTPNPLNNRTNEPVYFRKHRRTKKVIERREKKTETRKGLTGGKVGVKRQNPFFHPLTKETDFQTSRENKPIKFLSTWKSPHIQLGNKVDILLYLMMKWLFNVCNAKLFSEFLIAASLFHEKLNNFTLNGCIMNTADSIGYYEKNVEGETCRDENVILIHKVFGLRV